MPPAPARPTDPALPGPRGRRRVASRALAGLLLAAAALAGGLPAAAQTLRIDRALTVEAESSHFPAELVARAVDLPDDWSVSRPLEPGPAWYRVAFDAPGAHLRRELLGLYIERACTTLEVQLNGERVHLGGRLQEPVTRNCGQPLLVTLPAALLKPQGNLLDLKLAGPPLQRVASRQRAAGLSALELGTEAALAPRYRRAELLRSTLPQFASAGLLMLGLALLLVAGRHRADSALRYFAALAIGWALLGARTWWHELPLPSYDVELLIVTAVPALLLAGVLFMLRDAGYRSRPIEVALYAQCVAVPASLLVAGPGRLHMLASSWYGLLTVQAIAALGFYLWWTRRRHSRAALPLAAAGLLALVVTEVAAQRSQAVPGTLALADLAIPALLLLVGLRLIQRHALAQRLALAQGQTLDARVREATEEIERNFAELAELRVEQVTERERKRIAADLHDDLGAKLLTIVHTSEDQRISTLAREALEEMRLSVRGLTGKPVRLIDALGDWRAEVVSRLAQAGIESEWVSPTEDLPQTLSARAYVQTTRILREAVNNIIKHSGASRCALRCALTEGDFVLVIQDNGKGIPLELDGRLDRGHGMSSMKHRAKQLHGQCLVESGPGYGTVIRLTLPLERQVE